MTKTYRDLIAWRKAMELVLDVYRATKAFPETEIYGIAQQLQRCAVSVPSNIAEGQARFSRPEFHRFLRMARGSLAELETQVMIAHGLGYMANDSERELLTSAAELGRILNALIASLEKSKSEREVN